MDDDINKTLGKLPGFVNVYEGYTREQALASVNKGWASLVEKVFDAKPEGATITQVKEKFGGLRIYWSNATKEWSDLIDQTEEESFTICEICGEPGSLDESRYWVLTLCDKHKAERAAK